eukprot:COSAG01_NODE_1673_length_9542_cov_12.825765_9_plen_155_part_00
MVRRICCWLPAGGMHVLRVTTQELHSIHDRWSSLVSQYFLTTELLRCIPSNAGAPSAAVPTRELHRRRRSSLVTAKELPRSNSTQLRSYAYGGAPSLGYDATGELLRRQNVSPLATLFTTGVVRRVDAPLYERAAYWPIGVVVGPHPRPEPLLK